MILIKIIYIFSTHITSISVTRCMILNTVSLCILLSIKRESCEISYVRILYVGANSLFVNLLSLEG